MPIFGGTAPTHGQTLGTVSLGDGTFVLQIVKLAWPGLGERESIDVTSMLVEPTTATDGVGNMQSVPSAYAKCGKLVLKCLHDPTQTPIPLKAPVDTVQVKLGPALSIQQTFDGFGYMTKYDLDGEMNGKALTVDVEIEMTDVLAEDGSYDGVGGVTITPAS